MILPLIGSVLVLVSGHLALGEIDRSGGQLGGRGMAQVGLVLGYSAVALEILGVLIFVVFPVLDCGFCGVCGALPSVFGAWTQTWSELRRRISFGESPSSHHLTHLLEPR